jgi:murein DD-endopeptidase MepM/ murein hydrolase activator NlpD
VSSKEVQPQIEALRSYNYQLNRSDQILPSDSLETVFRKLGLQDAAAMAFIRSDSTARTLTGRGFKQVSATTLNGQSVQKIVARWVSDESGNFNRLTIEKSPQGWLSHAEVAPLKANVTLATGVIRTSLFAATDEARIPDAVATQLVRLFEGDIDFHRGMRKGDRFTLQYETLEADGEPLKAGRVLAAEMVNGKNSYSALWLPMGGDKGEYYSFEGESFRRTYLTSPLEFSRISSGFAMRMHPIHKTWKKHLGVDYAAGTGTPVRTVGDGVVVSAGWNASGYGNMVEIKHNNASHATLYAHLSKVAVKKGQSVRQGTVIGNVGSTGWSTGPHLHFEFRVGGVHHDPLQLVRSKEPIPMPAGMKPQFLVMAKQAKASLDTVASYTPARAE